MRTQSDNSFPIVGIGASAGGLEALEVLLTHLPNETGMAFVLVQHLDPGHPSLMPELLARYTRIPIQAAEQGMRVKANHLYVMTPNVTLTIKSGVLQTATPIDHAKVRTHIDTFLRSLAEDQTVHAVGLVLSGAGSDGTVGLKSIKEQGGVTMVQSPTSAKYDSMPLSAISTGLVDYTLALEEIPTKLVEHARYLENVKRTRSIKGLQQEAIEHLPRICEIVHHVTGHDFSGYKPNTMARRIERRLQVNHLDSVVSYVAKLEKDPAEAEELLKDFLIGVTQFFRDPDAFDALAREVIPRLLENKGANARVRVWVPGCASGEEAYSIAILLHAELTKLNVAPSVQIFATDIDGDAIGVARLGKYPATLVEQLSPARRERFFTHEGDSFQVIKPIRDMCVFSIHNVVRDPPFSSLDLISCRNLLIYMDAGLQNRLIPLFHYALSPRGYLFLGGSEGLADHAGLFLEADKKHRIYQRIDAAVRPPMFFPTADRILASGRNAEPAKRLKTLKANDIGSIVERMAIREAPPCVVVNEKGAIIYSSGDAGLYLQQPKGAPTLDIIEQANPGLRVSLRAAIRDATASHAPSVQKNLTVTTPAGPRAIDILVRPLPELARESGLFAVSFQPASGRPESPPATSGSVDESLVQQLESELKATRGELQTTVEELETSNEELKSSNEELLSMNEELQSANEELQTSKEEMQSVNEELATVNSELNGKVELLDTANADLQNLFRSTEIATLFLDRNLHIKRFTPAATAIFHLIDSDVGRAIGDFASRLADSDLVSELKSVLRTSQTIERQAYLPETQSWFMVRILPSRAQGNTIDGIVVTFASITALKKAEEELRQGKERSELAQQATAVGIFDWDMDADLAYLSPEWLAVYGLPPNATPLKHEDWVRLIHPEDREAAAARALDAVRNAKPYEDEFRVPFPDGTVHWIRTLGKTIFDEQGRPTRFIGTAFDISPRKEAELALAQSQKQNEFLAGVIRNASQPLAIGYADGRLGLVNTAFEKLTGYTAEELHSIGWVGLTPPEFHQFEWDKLAEQRQTGLPIRYEKEYVRKDGTRVPIELLVHLVSDSKGEPEYYYSFVTDITQRKMAEDALWQSERRLQIALLNAPITVYTNDAELRYTWIHKPKFGFTAEQMIGKRDEELLSYEAVAPLIEMKKEVLATGRGMRRHLHAKIEGKLYAFDVTIEPQHDSTGKINGLIVATMDISDIANAKSTAEAASKAKDHFLAVLSHELRTPLAPVLTTAELLASDEGLSTDQREMVHMIRRNVELEARLIDDLLDVTRITQNKLELRTELVDAHRKILLVIDMCSPDAAAKQIVIERDLSADPCHIQADPARFQQILWNILKNAIKFTPAKGRVSVSTRNSAPDRVAIKVSDTGIGISPNAISHIFDAFEQGSREVTKTFGGLGLGLAITKALVQLHGGTIAVASDGKNKGATFVVGMPVAVNSVDSQPVPIPEKLSRLECSILLVEDHPDTRKIMARLLTGLGCAVTSAGTVAEALDAAEKQTFSIVISDIGLPDAAGTELMRELKRRHKLKGVALSGYGMEEDLVNSADAGFDAHLVKPVNLQLLEDTVRRLIFEC